MASSRNVQFRFNAEQDGENDDTVIRSEKTPTPRSKSQTHEYSDIAQDEDGIRETPTKISFKSPVLKRQTSSSSSSGVYDSNKRNEPTSDRNILNYPPEDEIIDEKEDDNIVVDIVTRMRRLSLPESYETVANSLATINPLLASHAERLKMRIRIVHKDKESETKDITPQGLLIEILNYVREIDCHSGSSTRISLPRRPSRSNNLNHIGSSATSSSTEHKPNGNHSPHGTDSSNTSSSASSNYDKRDFIQDLRSRDIRRLETRYSMIGGSADANNEQNPYLLIRRHCVVLCLGSFIRAIIQANRFILVVQQDVGNEAMLNQLEESIKELLRNNNSSSHSSDTQSTATVLDQGIIAHHYHPMKYSTQVQTPFISSIDANSSNRASDSERDSLGKGSMTNAAPNTSMHAQNYVAYEIQVYEALMTVVLSLLRQQYEDCSITTNEVLRAIGKNSLLSVTLQEQMRMLKDQVRELSSRCSSYCKLLSDILQTEDDDEYSYLYLSELYKDPKLYDVPICEGSKVLFSKCSDIETIFDSLLMDFEGLEKGSQSLLKKLESAEISVGLRLDASRNQLLVATTIISIISSTIAFAGFITGAFGMNLDNSAKFEVIDGFFASVVTTCLIFIIVGSALVIIYFEDEGWIPQHDYLNYFRTFRRSISNMIRSVFSREGGSRRNSALSGNNNIGSISSQKTSTSSIMNPLVHR